jgi:hypothetical protein
MPILTWLIFIGRPSMSSDSALKCQLWALEDLSQEHDVRYRMDVT